MSLAWSRFLRAQVLPAIRRPILKETPHAECEAGARCLASLSRSQINVTYRAGRARRRLFSFGLMASKYLGHRSWRRCGGPHRE
jgi:hypothetical protein